MANTHDHAVRRLGRHFEAGRQLLRDRIQGMVSSDLKFARQPFENSDIAVCHRRWLSVHRIIEDAELTTECLNDSLQAGADTEYRNSTLRCIPDRIRNVEIRRAA